MGTKASWFQSLGLRGATYLPKLLLCVWWLIFYYKMKHTQKFCVVNLHPLLPASAFVRSPPPGPWASGQDGWRHSTTVTLTAAVGLSLSSQRARFPDRLSPGRLSAAGLSQGPNKLCVPRTWRFADRPLPRLLLIFLPLLLAPLCLPPTPDCFELETEPS